MRTIICSMLVVTSAISAHAQSVPPSRAADAALIRKEIEIICQAFVDKDRKVLEETHGKEWRGFTPGNDHVIRGIDGYMNEATFGPNAQKGQGMVGYKITDFDVVFYRDTAVVLFVLETIEPDGSFGTLKSNLDGSRGFAAGGGKLTRLVFPKTEVQAYGATAVLYTTYEMDLLSDGKKTTQKGAATEMFVRQSDGHWVNTGWQLASVSR